LGLLPVLVNCNCFSEGFDSPAVELVVQAKPTKSRSLYAQQIGRGTRPLPGIVDGLDNAEQRRGAIAASAKPLLTVLDFVGNSGRHKLMTSLDILGGKTRDDILEKAAKRLAKTGKAQRVADVIDEIEEEERQKADAARRDIEARKANLVAKVKFDHKFIDPFSAFGLTPVKMRGWDAGKVLSEKQRSLLAKQGFDPNMPAPQGKQVIAEIFNRWNQKLCTAKQANVIRKYSHVLNHPPLDASKLSMKEASALIDTIAAKQGWRSNKPKPQPKE
jgi:type I site-specific restriction endonuclease